MSVTAQDVLNAFVSLKVKSTHIQALKAQLSKAGFKDDEIVDAINQQIKLGVLIDNSIGEIKRS